MTSTELLRTEVTHYQILADQLKTEYAGIDDEALQDTLEGISDLPDLIQEIVRSGLDDDAYISALKNRIDDMRARLDRLKARFDKKRELVGWAMNNAGIQSLQASDFSVTLRLGPQKVEILDESKIPEDFLTPQPPKLNRTAISAALKRGDAVEGATLCSGDLHIAVRVK